MPDPFLANINLIEKSDFNLSKFLSERLKINLHKFKKIGLGFSKTLNKWHSEIVNFTVDNIIGLRDTVPAMFTWPLRKMGVPNSWIPHRYQTQYEVYMSDDTENPDDAWEYGKDHKAEPEAY